MFKKDNFIYGLLGGLLLPVFAGCYEFSVAPEAGRKSTVLLISIGLNLLLVRMAYKKELPRLANGIMLVTFVAAIAFFYFKHHL